MTSLAYFQDHIIDREMEVEKQTAIKIVFLYSLPWALGGGGGYIQYTVCLSFRLSICPCVWFCLDDIS